MSNEVMGNTKAELLQWMKGKNRTFGWGALIAMDRSTVNNAFREQYISSFSKNSYMPAISATAKPGDNTYVIFDQCVLSEPMLSFLDSSIADSEPVANLTMEVVGGREMTLEYSNNDDAECRRVIQVNALNPTTLAVKTALKIQAEAGTVGAIVVDLKEGKRYDVSSSNTAMESKLSGDAFQKEFATWPDDQRIWEVNKLVGNEGSLSVEDFVIRCQKAPGSTSRGASNYGDGSVVIFVQTTKSKRGTAPTTEEELRYLIPDDDSNPYTVTTVVSQTAMLAAITDSVFEPTADRWVVRRFEYDDSQIGNERIEFNRGAVKRDSSLFSIDNYEAGLEGWSGINDRDIWELAHSYGGSSAQFYVEHRAGAPDLYCFKFSLDAYLDHFSVYLNGVLVDREKHVRFDGAAVGRASAVLDVGSQSIRVAPAQGLISYAQADVKSYTANINRDKLTIAFNRIGSDSLLRIVEGFGDRATPIALLPLNSILFQGAYTNRLSELHQPHDSVMFGHVAPQATAFEINDPLLVMGAGRLHRFAISGSNTGVTWTVDNLPDEEAPTGSIDSSGRYTAPSREQIAGVQTRVKITARKAGASASALVTVVRKEINVNPLVQFVIPGSTCDLVAGSLGASRTWGAIDPAKGSLRDSTTAGRDKTFVAPAVGAKGVTLDLVPITVTSDGVTETAYVGVVHNSATLNLVTGPIDVAARKVKLTAMWTGEEEEDVAWEVIAGCGTIDPSTGELTADEFPVEPFVMVLCTYAPKIKGYLVLPLPLAPYPKKSDLPETFQARLLLS